MNKICIFFIFILLINLVSATELDCKYKDIEEYYETESGLFYEGTNVKAGEKLIFSGFNTGEITSSFVVKNPNNFKIMVILNYTVEGDFGFRNTQYGQWIQPNSEIQKNEVCINGEILGNCTILSDSLHYYIAKPDILYPREVQIKKIREVCLRNKNGEACSLDSDCDSDRCIQNKCSPNELCDKLDCGCSENQTQCPENNRCVNNNYLNNSFKPICSAKECITDYVNPKTGLCDKKPFPKWAYVILVFLVLVTGIFYQRCKENREKERRKADEAKIIRINKEIEKLREEDEAVKRKKEELKHLEDQKENSMNELKKIEDQKNDASEGHKKKLEETAKKYKEKLDEVKIIEKELLEKESDAEQRRNKIKKLNEEADNELEKIRIRHGIKYWKNPKYNYYPCYVNNGIKGDILIHRDIAEKQIYNYHKEFFNERYPCKTFNDLEVHHIDHDGDHFDHRNLVIISKTEHGFRGLHNVPTGDYLKGIAELKKHRIKNPHISELK